MDIRNGNCLELLKTLPEKSVDLFICDLPYGETSCKWDTKIDMEEFWKQFKRVRNSKKTACIHFCSTKFGYTLIKSWESGFKMEMVFKKRNKTGGLQSRLRPMRNHEMIYFFHEQSPKYNRDKYHKRIKSYPAKKENGKDEFGNNNIGVTIKECGFASNLEPANPASVLEEEEEKCLYGFNKKDKVMQWTEKDYLELKRQYENAVSEDQEQFEFQGVELLTTFAKYLIEFLDKEFKPKS